MANRETPRSPLLDKVVEQRETVWWFDISSFLPFYPVFRFYGALLITVSLLYIAPVGWVLAFVINILFLWNREFYRGTDFLQRFSPTIALPLSLF